MKKILLLMVMVLCFFQYALSQELLSQIAVIKQAFNEKNVSILNDCLSDDCSILGRSGDDFKSTCDALFKRLENDTIVDMTLLSKERLENGATSYTFNIKYSELGEKKGIFDINSDGKISRLDYLSTTKVVSTTDVRHFRSSAAHAAASSLIKIPFTVGNNNLIIFKGELNGEEKNFILDSGAGHSFINSNRLNKKLEFGKGVLKGVNKSNATGLAVADSIDINISGIALKNASVLAKDLSFLEPTDTEIAAVIGMDILGDYDFIYDYDKGELTLINSQAKINLQGDSAIIIPYAELFGGYLPCIKAKIGDKELVFGIDCGATSNLISSQYESLVSDVQESDLVGITGEATKTKKGKMTFEVGGLNFELQDFIVSDISHLGLNIDGLLGYQFLKARKMFFRNSTKELIIF